MAMDTADKRASALLEGILPIPDALPLDLGDREQVLWQYRIDLQSPTFVGGPNDNGVFIGQPTLGSGGSTIGYGF